MVLWRVQQVGSRESQIDSTSFAQRRSTVTQLLGDGVVIANAMESTTWNGRIVQAMVCTECGIERCAAGGWISPRAVDGAVLWLPAFEEMAGDAPLAREYRPPEYFERGIPLFFEPSVTALLEQVHGFPAVAELFRLRTNELTLAMQWTAVAEVLGTFPGEVRLRHEDVIAVSHGEREMRIREVERLLREGAAASAVVTLRALQPDEEAIAFYLDAPGHPAWSPLAIVGGEPVLHLDGLVAQRTA